MQVTDSMRSAVKLRQQCTWLLHLVTVSGDHAVSRSLFKSGSPNLSSLLLAVPQQLLSKVDHIISLAEEDSIPTTKVSDLLTLIIKIYGTQIYRHGHSASQDKFSMRGASGNVLDKCDAAFEKVPSSGVIKKSDQAKGVLESCGHSAGE